MITFNNTIVFVNLLQGCMNNFTFGDAGMGYYETIAGGAGAGPGWHGRSGVHTHMTNTRITDPEILERRYPVVLHQFRLRPGSGGAGMFQGGDGVVRELEFLRPLTVSILSERRSVPPFGLLGGRNAAKGVNLWIKKDGRKLSLGGKATVQVAGGDRVMILSPGGGGYGPPPEPENNTTKLIKNDGTAGEEESEYNGSDYVDSMEELTRVEARAMVERLVEWRASAGAGGEYSVPVKDGGSVQRYKAEQESV